MIYIMYHSVGSWTVNRTKSTFCYRELSSATGNGLLQMIRKLPYYTMLLFLFFFFHREFGIIILVLISSCLLHLVVTAYFFFLEIFGDRVSAFTHMYIDWINRGVISSIGWKIFSKFPKIRTSLQTICKFGTFFYISLHFAMHTWAKRIKFSCSFSIQLSH